MSRWLAANPDANLGVTTGPGSGVWVLDADGAEGVEAVRGWEDRHGALPRTPVARTGGGGRHYYFGLPEGAKVANTTKVHGARVDVRGDGGYVVVPPSRHASGAGYSWQVSPDEAAPAPAPDWLLGMLAAPPRARLPRRPRPGR